MIYRTEHPKPQFCRENWTNLNGIWEFEIDHGDSGEERNLFLSPDPFAMEINVPFCPESKLSGIEYKDFMGSVWYRKRFILTPQQAAGRTVLHFGAVDYYATVWVNGKKCGTHRGGYVSFSFDITDYVNRGENVVVLHAQDDCRDRRIPRGKQSPNFHSSGCVYTRTTGIWQTVWLEFTPKTHIHKAKFFPDADAGTLTIQAELSGSSTFRAEAAFDGKSMGSADVVTSGGCVTLTLSLAEKHLWQLGVGGLYDLKLTFGDDTVSSYFGLRSIRYENKKFFLNGKSVFQRTILDQGFYPDGIYTAPSDAELIADIDRSMAMGFNGARLHEKVFEERFLYHADRKGYLVWGEFPNWGLDLSYADSVFGILPEWLEEVERDFNHPAIVGWCPFNETWDSDGRKQIDAVLALVYQATKAADPTRPCIDTSGNYHVVTDIYDLHDYEQDPDTFREHLKDFDQPWGLTCECAHGHRQSYDGKLPFFVSEYGGIRWTEDCSGWGYGEAPKTPEEFLSRLKGLTDVLLDDPRIFGLCYTQLTDVEQEQNGLYTYDRRPKFPPKKIYPILARKAAIED